MIALRRNVTVKDSEVDDDGERRHDPLTPTTNGEAMNIAYIELPCKVGDLVALLDGERAWEFTLDIEGDVLVVRR
jgi:hypothetical protein